LVFAAAIKANASSIILSHNHPSGNLMPSEQDKRLTQRMVEAGRLLDIPVIEHIIITEEGYFSFADEGIL
jgi:DNA repair protein RadC